MTIKQILKFQTIFLTSTNQLVLLELLEYKPRISSLISQFALAAMNTFTPSQPNAIPLAPKYTFTNPYHIKKSFPDSLY